MQLTKLPTWAKVLGLVLLAGALLWRGKGGRMQVNAQRLLALRGFTKGKVPIVAWMVDEWSKTGRLTPDDQAALLAAAWKEGGLKLNAISADGLPDDKLGKDWGTFQFTAQTLETLRSSIEEVTPRRRPDGSLDVADLERAARASARVAERMAFFPWKKFGRRPYLEYWRELHKGDLAKIARELFTSWNTGSKAWAEVAAVAPSNVPGTLGYAHKTVGGKLAVLNDFREGLGLSRLSLPS
jgi:hypothetical protein